MIKLHQRPPDSSPQTTRKSYGGDAQGKIHPNPFLEQLERVMARIQWEETDECQILCIWTPLFTLVRPLDLLFSDALVSFCVFMFCRSISEDCLENSEVLNCLENLEVLKNSIDRT